MNPTESQMQGLNDPNGYIQLDTVQDNVSQVSTSTSIITPLDINEQHQKQEAVDMSECSFFYRPCNDFQIYHIVCKEIPLSFELVSRLLDHNDNNSTHHVQSNNIYVFYHKQIDSKKIYKVTCEMISHTSIFQFLNKIIYGIEFNQIEQRQQEFSKIHQENLKFHLEKDLIYYLSSKQVYNTYGDFTFPFDQSQQDSDNYDNNDISQ